MTTALRYRLLRSPRMPPELVEAAQGPDVLLSEAGVSIRITAKAVRLPGVRSSKSAKLNVGALVVRRDRVLAAVGRHVVLDAPLHGTGSPGQRVTFSPDGVRLELEVASFYPQGSGTFTLRYTVELSDPVRAQLPAAVPVTVDQVVPLLLRGWA